MTLSKDKQIFNTAFDVGMRILFILNTGNKSIDLQSLVYFDYFLIHSGDIKNGPKSLHPKLPFSSGEILTRRELVKDGLHMMYAKNLINIVPRKSGIYYKKSALTTSFIDLQIKTNYVNKLAVRAKWVYDNFASFSEAKLQKYVHENFEEMRVELISTKNEK